MKIENKKFLVIGSALSGSAVVEFLLSKGAFVVLTDVKPKKDIGENIGRFYKNENFKGVFGVQPSLSLLEGIEYIITSPGVPMTIPIIENAKKQGIDVLSEIELSYRLSKGRIIAITGTNGKTTTTSLLGEIFKKSKEQVHIVGNIGTPMISKLKHSTKNDCFIVEVSSFQLEGTSLFKPNISAILNIAPDHLNRHITMGKYIAEKSKIFLKQDSGDITILNADDPATLSLQEHILSRVVLFSRLVALEEGVFVESGKIFIKDKKKKKIEVCSVSDIKILGKHNLENVLAAIAISYHAGIANKNIKEAIRKFNGVSHRIEIVDTIRGVDFINDSKGTNPQATIKAIEAMEKPTILIAGGMDKGNDFQGLIQSFKGKVKHLILLGETADLIENIAIKQGFNNIIKVNGIEKAVNESYKIAQVGDVILLSPACASWDMFQSFEERGDAFKDAVKNLRRGSND